MYLYFKISLKFYIYKFLLFYSNSIFSSVENEGVPIDSLSNLPNLKKLYV